MKLEQSIRQSQRLLLSQTMQQSLKVLQMDGFSLREYLNDLSMSNPLVDVPASSDIDVSNFEPGTASTYGNLYDYLNMQVELRYSDKPLRKVVTALIQNLDHDGLLQVDEERFIAEQGIDQVQFLDALTLLQSLDPPGVGGRTLQEVLVVQARMLPDCPPLVTEILTNHYWDFLHNDVHRILTTTDATVDEFLQAKAIIGGFTAHPGAGFGDEQTQYRIPDIKVRPSEGGYRVYLTKAGRPQLVFNTDEYDELRQRGDEQLQSYLGNLAEEYHSVKRILQRREDTIGLVAQYVVGVQWPYLNREQGFINELLLRDVASAVGASESTVSRALKDEYIDSPRGVLPMNSLLTRRSTSKEEHSADNELMHGIRTIVEGEDPQKPLSDQKIADALEKQGIKIARRTVAKYRGLMGIADKKMRKK